MCVQEDALGARIIIIRYSGRHVVCVRDLKKKYYEHPNNKKKNRIKNGV